MAKNQNNGWTNFEGKVMKVYVKEVKYKKGGKTKSFKTVNVSVGRKINEEDWVNVYYEVVFGSECDITAEDLENGENTIICSGFLSCTAYNDKNGNQVVKPAVVLTKAELDEVEF